MGKATMKQAEAFKEKDEALIGAGSSGSMDSVTANWVAERDDTTHARLAAVGLVKARASQSAALGPFIDAHLERHGHLKRNTVLNFKQVRRWLVQFFGESRDMRSVTAADAEDVRLHMVQGGLGENTVRRHIGRCRQLWKAAIRRWGRGINPFEGMVSTVRSNKAREFFVTRDTTQTVIDACPDAEWKLIVALSRYGGLRCPSEHLALKWAGCGLEEQPYPGLPSWQDGAHRREGIAIDSALPRATPLPARRAEAGRSRLRAGN